MNDSNNVPDIQADSILSALAAAYPDDADEIHRLLTHALADLRHMADKHDLDFGDCDTIAHGAYLAERVQ
ncbi:MAG: hypothetical protein WBB85_20495 [Albidovulum sp.]|uniref:hypothetical protein n=1 Tax=Albidovulum sp. TaxID=1872424 RepID=UPI003C9870BD